MRIGTDDVLNGLVDIAGNNSVAFVPWKLVEGWIRRKEDKKKGRWKRNL
jgi:hypothetical protein